MTGRGSLRALRERFFHACVGPTGRWCELHGLGRPVGEGSTRSSTVAHHVGTGEPCPPMEEQRD